MTAARRPSPAGLPRRLAERSVWPRLFWTAVSVGVHAAIFFWAADREVIKVEVAFEEEPFVLETFFIQSPVDPPPPPPDIPLRPPPPPVQEQVLIAEEESPQTVFQPLLPEELPPPEPEPPPLEPEPPPPEIPEPEPEPEPELEPVEIPEPEPEPDPEPERPPEPPAPPPPEPVVEEEEPEETLPQPAAPASSRVVLDDPPEARHNPNPRYPEAARRRGIEGVVRMRVQVDEAGRVTHVEVVESAGATLLDRSAVSATQRWRFEPVRVDGRAVEAEFVIDITFTLNEPD